jgi:23S rRNA (pseudouridine1915-N3)-methyltransferase
MIRLIILGKIKDSHLQALCEEFTKRISQIGKLSFELVVWKDCDDKKFSEKIKEYKQKHSDQRCILLDEEGKQYSTAGFHSFLFGQDRPLTFFIAGAYGFPKNIKECIKDHMSISSLTVTHEMAAYIFLEQLYRISSIAAGLPYHKE